MADMIDSGKISFACELDKDLETSTTESNTEARITFTETQIVLGLGNDKSIKYKATGQGTDLTNYYNKSQVDEKLKLKVDKTQLGDYYNKSEIDTSLSNKADKTVLESYYNKSDIDGKLANKVDTTTLNDYDLSTEVDNKVKVVSDKVGDLSTLETGVKSTVVAAINEVKRAQTEAGKVTNLNDLGDVNASAPRRGQFLGWDQDTHKWISKDVETDGIATHIADFNNPHRTTINKLNDTTINTPKANQVLVYNGTKWINKDVPLNDSNYAKKNEANIFTKKQSGVDGTEDANFVTLKQLKTKVGLTGNETIGGNKTFSSPIIIPNATANNHSLPLGQANTLYSKLLTQNLEWTVGTGGEFANLQTAINEAAKFINNKDYILTLKLISNIETNNPILIKKLNIPFVHINFNGFKVKITSETIGFYIWSSKIGKILKPYVESYSTCFHFLHSTCEQIGFSDTSYTCKLSCSIPNISISTPISGIQLATGSAVILKGKFQFLTPDTNKHCFTSSSGGFLDYRHPTEVIQSSGVAFNVINGAFISNVGVTVTGGASKNSQTPNVVSKSGIIFG